MSTLVDLLPQQMPSSVANSRAVAWPEETSAKPEPWSVESFAGEQIHELVRQLFFSSAAPWRQVAFGAVDPETEVRPICLQVGEVLAQRVTGSVCVVEALSGRQSYGIVAEPGFTDSSHAKRFGALRDSSEQISGNLWFMSAGIFCGGSRDLSAVGLRARLAELRLEFDYTVLEGPIASHGDAAALGSLTDGLVLVLQANFTRRVTAQKAKDRLSSANARLLGTVLTGRTFPIPEALYKRL
ncbi:MAG: hypothetical protein WB952_20125 [Terriglobales bacterium]